MNRIAVYCGSSSGDSSLFKLAATQLGALIASQGMTLVYGGARIGLMGAVADAALAAGGDVIGVIPGALMHDEVVHDGLTHLEVVGSMHERKARMLDLADAVVAMPGGLGTLDELFEALTWAQLRFHAKPIGMLNLNGYFDALLTFLDDSVSTGFLSERNRALLLDATTPELIIHRLLNAP
jgi:uncharacterized protein (TIGR00730 family)